MWWKFGLPLVVIVVVAALATLADIGSIAASDSCGGCDASPAWVGTAWWAVGAALVIWLTAALFTAASRARTRRLARRT